MSLERRWVAQCDRDDCSAVLIVPPPNDGGPDDKASAGIYTSDEGWDARPNRRETYCPVHKEAPDA